MITRCHRKREGERRDQTLELRMIKPNLNEHPYSENGRKLGQKQEIEYGLSMGASNSPALACRFGLAFIRMLRERFKQFKGKGIANCWWTGFEEMGLPRNCKRKTWDTRGAPRNMMLAAASRGRVMTSVAGLL